MGQKSEVVSGDPRFMGLKLFINLTKPCGVGAVLDHLLQFILLQFTLFS